MEQIKKGVFEVTNPYNRRKFIVPATPGSVHTIVFWSKNFAPFLKGKFGQTLLAMGYNLFFNFTINSDIPLLEPRVPSLKQRLDQLRDLSRNYDSKTINWRFDPVCFFKFEEKIIKDNLHDFSRIATWASQCGVTRCITSFMDHYSKIKKRIKLIPGFSFIDPILSEKIGTLLKLEKELSEKNVDLYACCEKEVLNALPSGSNIRKGSCIPNDLFVKIFGGDLSFKRDTGQRSSKGCGCMISVDIGSYHLHPCYHNCLFCYANPTQKVFRKNVTI
ncbi:MAG: DUF1848 domain-containing protein [Desulfobacterales bacterium]|nr:DUF1848 domain-containing protein [Desulfobacterales bacterium]